MNRKLLASLFVFSLAACATGDRLNLQEECTYANGDDAPIWTCNSSVALDYKNLRNVAWATGEAKKIKAGRSLQTKAAVLDGRAKLLERIVVRVKSVLTQHAKSSEAEAEIESFVESFAEGTLKGSQRYTRAIDPSDGYMYVIVGINNAQFKQNIEDNENYQRLLQKIESDREAGGKPAANAIKKELANISSIVLQ